MQAFKMRLLSTMLTLAAMADAGCHCGGGNAVSGVGANGEPVLPITKPIASATAGELLPFTDRAGTFAIESADAGDAAFTLSEQAQQWVWTVEGQSITRMVRNDAGDIAVTSEDDLVENVKVTYDPALVILPATLDSDKPQTFTAKMHVTDLPTGATKQRGMVACRITLEGIAPVDTPAGTFDAYVVRTDRRMNFGLAEAQVRLDSAYVLERGLVWERMRQRVKFVGMGGETTQRTISLKGD